MIILIYNITGILTNTFIIIIIIILKIITYPCLGTFRTSSEILDAQNRWSRIQGERSIGRWAVGSTRNIDIIKPSNENLHLSHSTSKNLLSNNNDNNNSSSVGNNLKMLGNNTIVSNDDLKRPFLKPPLQRQVSYEKGKFYLC